MEEKIKILQLAPRYPFPEDDGGKIGIANITKEFSRLGNDVTFFCFYDAEIPTEHKKMIEPYAKLITYKHSIRNTIFRIIISFFKKQSLYISKYQNKRILKFLEELVKREKFDIIHADHSSMAPYALNLKQKFGIKVGLRLHNIEWMIWQRYADVLHLYNPARYYIQMQTKKLRRDEQQIYKKVDVAFAITENDRIRAKELMPDSNVEVATAGVDIDFWKPDDNIIRNDNELIIATTYQWRHNVDGVKWFIENVMPELRRMKPDIKLTLIGKDAPPWLKKYEHLGVSVPGYVDRVQPYLNKATLYVTPLFVGGGIRIKILEAMSMKIPVLATSIAAEGISAGKDDGLVICDTTDEFVSAIKNLLGDKGLQRRMGENARNFIKSNYSWNKNVNIMYQEYLKISTNKN